MSIPSIFRYFYRIFHLIVVARSTKITAGALLLLVSFRVGAICTVNTSEPEAFPDDISLESLEGELGDEEFFKFVEVFEQLLESTAILQSRSTNIIGLNPLIVAESDTGGSAGAENQLLKKPLSFFTSYLNGSGNSESSSTKAEYEWDVDAVVVGADYRMTPEVSLGLMFGRSDFSGCRAGEINTTFSISHLVGFNLNGEYNTVSSFGIWETDTIFFDTIFSIGTGSFDYKRRQINSITNIEEQILANYGSKFIRAGIAGGRKFQFSNLGIDVYGRFSYSDISIDGYNERLQSGSIEEDFVLDIYTVDESKLNSLTSGIGSRINLVHGASSAIISSYLNFEWIHDFESTRESQAYIQEDSTLGDLPLFIESKIDQNYWSVGLGASALFKNGITLFGGVNTLIDFDLTDELLVGFGGRFEF